MSKAIERQIQQIYNSVFKKVFSSSSVSALSKGSKLDAISRAKLLEQSKDYDKFAVKFALALSKKGLASKRGVWRHYYRAAKSLHYVALPKTYTEYEAKVLSQAVKQNFKMIKSMPTEVLSMLEHKYTSTLIEEVAKGSLTRGAFMRELQLHGHKNAKVIARTETAKLQTVIAENRAINIGSVAYTWLSSNDRRTRQSHKNMNGVIVFWRNTEQKPLLDNMRGNAGEFPNCRCSPQPIVDVEDLTKSIYKVYDYRYDRIVSMNKHDLISALKRRSLD